MIVVNLVSAPCAGKSTLASKLFYKLKTLGYSVEMIMEFAKELYYEDNKLIESQIQVFSEQLRRQRRVQGKVDILITDSPLLLSIIYNREPNPYFEDMIAWEFKSFDNLVYFLERGDIPYQQAGRFQNESEARELDNKIIRLMETLSVPYTKVISKKAATTILSDIETKVKSKIKLEDFTNF
jgi:nicotinamide riboside kinase